MSAYYNEIDPFAAQWLRNLISAGHIAPGDVDERSITEIKPDELKQYTQCHFFAGIGVWSYALRRAGWGDSRPVWTGSCPCQPFSAAGKGKGTDDERHLWPAWFELVSGCQPAVIFGEQVASSEVVGKSDGTGENAWLDIVQTDLEGALYAVAPFDLPAAGFGAPHIRQRVWFVAERLGNPNTPRAAAGVSEPQERQEGHAEVDDDGGNRLLRSDQGRPDDVRLADASDKGCKGQIRKGAPGKKGASSGYGSERRSFNGLADTALSSQRPQHGQPSPGDGLQKQDRGHGISNGLADGNSNGCDQTGQGVTAQGGNGLERNGIDRRADTDYSMWASADWLGCRDGKFRPVEPGTSPLASSSAQRVGRLRAYGNAICAEVATSFVSAYMGNN